MSSLVERLINVKFTLRNGTFPDTGTNNITLSGLRVRVMLDSLGGVTLGSAQLSVSGMTLSSMNALVVINTVVTGSAGNTVTITAGDAQNGMSQCFEGSIYSARINYAAAPSVTLDIAAAGGAVEQITPVAPNSFKGSADVASIIGSLAKTAGFAFKNNGVTAQLSNPYFYGSAVTQIKAAAQAAGIAYDIHNGVVNIWPNRGTRDGTIIELSPNTGLVGYPSYLGTEIEVRMLFNPNIVRGRQVNLTTDVVQAQGTWFINSLSHEISSLDPNGPWFTTAKLIAQKFYVKS